jgi:four helix bundle protein
MSDYKNLLVWQKGHALALHAHRMAMDIRAARYSALRSQIIRAAMSVPANIVREDAKRVSAISRDSFGTASTLRTSSSTM